MGRPATDLAGERFGRLVAVERVRVEGKRDTQWLCRCDCGATVTTSSSHLTIGRTMSCGCLRRDVMKSSKRKHGYVKDGKVPQEYLVWSMMRQRCNNPNNKKYHRYGGRGIKVCQRWEESFGAFMEDMGPRPSKAHRLERTDNDGPYSPENCRWATSKEQARNTRKNRFVVVDGERMCLAEAAERYGVPAARISERLAAGWADEKAVKTPVLRRKGDSTYCL